jgi:hypothetical protein
MRRLISRLNGPCKLLCKVSYVRDVVWHSEDLRVTSPTSSLHKLALLRIGRAGLASTPTRTKGILRAEQAPALLPIGDALVVC